MLLVVNSDYSKDSWYEKTKYSSKKQNIFIKNSHQNNTNLRGRKRDREVRRVQLSLNGRPVSYFPSGSSVALNLQLPSVVPRGQSLPLLGPRAPAEEGPHTARSLAAWVLGCLSDKESKFKTRLRVNGLFWTGLCDSSTSTTVHLGQCFPTLGSTVGDFWLS